MSCHMILSILIDFDVTTRSQHVLAAEGCTAASLAYDRPSPKLLGFLRKHYSMSEFVQQNNNFVIFEQYYDTPAATSQAAQRRRRPVIEAVSSAVSACMGARVSYTPHQWRRGLNRVERCVGLGCYCNARSDNKAPRPFTTAALRVCFNLPMAGL